MSGSCAGIISTLVAHPLDTVKVRFQTATNGNLKLGNVVKEIYLNEGVSSSTSANSGLSFSHYLQARGFLKGVMSPMLGRAPIIAV